MRAPRRAPARGAALTAAALCLTLAPIGAHADPVDKIANQLVKLEAEAQTLSQSIHRPNIKVGDKNKAERRLVDAQVAFGIGNYDDAAIMLYDYVAKYPNSPSFDLALYYLAESLFLKGDFYASRTYFTTLVTDVGPRSKFYQQGLERLIELSLKLRDDSNTQQWLDALDKVPAAQQRDSVPYVRGKHAYFSGKYDESIPFFDKVPKDSKYWFQAHYFLAAAHVAKRDFVPAIRVYEEILDAPAKDADAKKVVELTHLALGRVYYECDNADQCNVQLSDQDKTNIRTKYERAKLTDKQLGEKFADARQKKLWAVAIDQYLMISRRSELFDEALYEIAWVYVKNKAYEKALRALELLALSDPDSSKMPEVRILEGNLRIRRGEALQFANKGNAQEEYDRAYKSFDGTRKVFKPAHEELVKIIDEHRDPRAFMAQITGRTSETFDVNSTMPEVAAEWLRKQPDVKRVVSIENDLGSISDEIEESEKTIARLEQAMSSAQSVNIFPALAEKRARSVEILEEVFDMRLQLLTHERALVLKHASQSDKAELERLGQAREAAFNAYKALPNSNVKYSERITLARSQYDELDQKANEVGLAIETTEATLVAIVKYVEDRQKQGAKPEELEGLNKPIEELRTDVNSMKTELASIRRDIVIARDRAGVGDEDAEQGKRLRAELRKAMGDEQAQMNRVAQTVGGSDRRKLDQIGTLVLRADAVLDVLDKTNRTIDETVNDVLGEVRGEVASEKASLSAYKREFEEYSAESRQLGGEVLAANFDAVRDDFYDVLVRSDIGVIDISWAQREFADKTLKKLELDKKREERTLRVNFDQVIKEEQEAKEAAHAAKAGEPAAGSDQGGDQ